LPAFTPQRRLGTNTCGVTICSTACEPKDHRDMGFGETVT
jgi:hypothetical protein